MKLGPSFCPTAPTSLCSPIENLQPREGHISNSLPTYVTCHVSIPPVGLQGIQDYYAETDCVQCSADNTVPVL